jgi:hypothetical protein
MYTLIIQVVAIGLGIAVSISSLYYGGQAMTRGTTKAVVSTVMNQGQQIASASLLFQVDNSSSITALSDLVTQEYLSSVPTAPVGTGWGFTNAPPTVYTYNSVSDESDIGAAAPAGDYITTTGGPKPVSHQQCNEINKLADGGSLFGCEYDGADAANNVAWYKI